MKLADLQLMSKFAAETDSQNASKMMYDYIKSKGMDPNCFYQELEMSSRFVDTHLDTSYSNAHMHLHSHTFYELIFCCNTCGAEYLVGPDRYLIKQGDLIFVPPGVSHRPLLPEILKEPYHRYVLWLSPEFMKMYAQMYPHPFSEKQNRASMLRTSDTKWEQLGDLFYKGIQEAQRQEDGWEAAVIGNTITLLTMIKRATNDRSAPSLKAEKSELLDRIMAFVEKNYANTITIGDLAKDFFVSSSTISHLFQQKLGISFYRFVTQRRLIAAKSLIQTGILLEAVAIQSGFPDYSNFYRAFKQEYGISPRQYRLQYHKK